MPPAVERWNLNPWTTREVPSPPFFPAFHVPAHGTPIQTAAPGKTARSSSVQAFMGDLVSQLITCRGALWHRSLSSCLSGLQVTSNLCGHIQMLSWTILLVGPSLGPQNWRAEQSAKLGSAADPLRCSCTGLSPGRPLLTHSVLQCYLARLVMATADTFRWTVLLQISE